MKTGGIFRNQGYSNTQLMMMFYFVCVVIRLGFAYFVWLFGDRTPVLALILIIGITGALLNLRGMMSTEKVWWFREFHLLMAIAISVTAGIALYYGGQDAAAASIFKTVLTSLLVADVGVGVATSLVKRPFS